MIPTKHIAAAACAAALFTGPGSADFNWTPQDSAAVQARVEAGEFGTVTSLLILQNGETMFEEYFDGADAETQHDTRSVTKTITGMLVGAAIADGHLQFDAPLAPLFEAEAPFANPDPRKLAITIEDLITMSGPLECDDMTPYSRGNEERMYLVEDWTSFFWDLPIRGYPSWVTPPDQSFNGRVFSYCTAGVQILGEAVERAAGEPLADYAQRRLFDPLGVDRPGWRRTGSGRLQLGGGLRLTTRDLAAFGELQRRGGEVDGASILPESWTAAAAETSVHTSYADGVEYGYLWWLRPYEVDGVSYRSVEMSGNGGNRVWVLPEFGITAVMTKTDYNTRGMHEASNRFLFEELVPRLRAP